MNLGKTSEVYESSEKVLSAIGETLIKPRLIKAAEQVLEVLSC